MPTAQTPVHDPPVHVWLVQGVALPHAPLALHVWTPVPEHCVVPGAHTPVQPPPTQAIIPQSTGSAQRPDDVQVWTPLPVAAHCVVPGAHGAPAS